MITYINESDWNNTKKVTKKDFSDFCKYVESFYGVGGIYDMSANQKQIQACVMEYLKNPVGNEFCADSVDREKVRDLLMEMFLLEWPTIAIFKLKK